ncbi:PP0621 family protein [Azonexus sp.]|uniref:PP0621 family protein n=1 Tax=Azonexus sp. TaxID=1872668 RepID=UPI0039E51560
MLKYLLLLLVIWVVWWAWHAPRRPGSRPRAQKPPQKEGEEKMLACARCGVYLPASEALPGPQGQYFCSPQHRDA